MQNPTCSMESMAQPHLQKNPPGNAFLTCNRSSLLLLFCLFSANLSPSLSLNNSSQFTLQGHNQQSADTFNHSVSGAPWAAAGQGLTFIGYQVDRSASLRKFFIFNLVLFSFHSYSHLALSFFVLFFYRTHTVGMCIQVQQWINV